MRASPNRAISDLVGVLTDKEVEELRRYVKERRMTMRKRIENTATKLSRI